VPSASGLAPSGLVYPSEPLVCVKGVAIAPDVPFYSGGQATNFSVAPALPPGLALNAATGAITGTPSAVSATAAYQVTASNTLGSTDLAVTITVNDRAPSTQPVVTLAPFVTALSTGVTATTPDQGHGMTYAWSLNGGTLVSGQGTPAITFTAGESGTVTAEVTVGNTGGSLSGRAVAAIVAAPNATLTYPVASRPGAQGIPANVTAQPGMAYLWTVISGASTATVSAGQGTERISLSVGDAPGTFQIQVKVQNQAGDYATATGTVKVGAGG
jgi:hypothetical protein